MMMTEKKRWVFFGLPFTFTKYEVTDVILTVSAGFLSKTQNPCYMYKITDVELRSTLFERIFGLGTVICYTGDTTHSVLRLEHIKNSKAIHAAILEASEEQRLKRRTVNMQNIDSDNVEMID